ncbi:MAG: hypothetical protein CME57_03920 [Halieaceae bacterium]|nr:hypothetical protein [Halieaceae bacterium]
MNQPGSPLSADALREGLHKASALEALLQEEFALLKAGDLDNFESLQAKKNETLESLSSLLPALTADQPVMDQDNDSTATLIQEIKVVLATCRDAHLKNAMLIDRKIEATRSALEVLRSSRSADTGETYDKLGRIKRGYSPGRQADV